MNRFLVFATLFTLLVNFAFGQQPQRCATTSYNKLVEQKNPALAERRAAFNLAAEKMVSEKKFKNSRDLITIPVVVHVIYRTNLENISDAQIQSQIDVLNEDFSRLNADTSISPTVWRDTAADTGIRFCLASRKPNGDWTNGIERRQNLNVMSWAPDDAMKFYNSGGLDVWDSQNYLNIWVCNLSGNFLGYTTFPGGDSLIDGVVVKSRAFGRVEFVAPPFDLGRTATHEVGHWLFLFHIWGDDAGSCLGTDLIDDTPNQADATQGCPAFPAYDNCSLTYPGIMFMNYMDYTNDACMNIFTIGQANRMHTVIDTFRAPLLTSLGCTAPNNINEIEGSRSITIYPNPVQKEIRFRCDDCGSEKISVSIFDITGKGIFEMNNYSFSLSSSIDISSIEDGVYFLKLTGQRFSLAERFVLIR
ncbi:MAG: T9SS type A sorting domain-containing protein [Bacteroidia bacterium]|nr:T9SS type A sorting domain-containing protein [Bacteroidia bacterium]